MQIRFIDNPVGEQQASVLAEMHELKQLINRAVEAHEFDEAEALRNEWRLCHEKLVELDKLVQ